MVCLRPLLLMLEKLAGAPPTEIAGLLVATQAPPPLA